MPRMSKNTQSEHMRTTSQLLAKLPQMKIHNGRGREKIFGEFHKSPQMLQIMRNVSKTTQIAHYGSKYGFAGYEISLFVWNK